MFGSSVSRDVGCAGFSGNRSDIDNPSPTSDQHRRQSEACAMKGAGEVDRQMTLPHRLVSFHKRRGLGYSRIVDQNVRRPPELLDGKVKSPLDISEPRHAAHASPFATPKFI